MNCMLQKALKDRVKFNKCVLDSVLWFHLECPRHVAKFDNPIEFKRKWRDFFAISKSFMQHLQQSEEADRIEDEFGHVQYPEDVKVKQDVQ